jgi:hypothetical protein
MGKKPETVGFVKFKLSKLKSMILVRKSELAQIMLGLAQLKSNFSA